MKLGLIGHGAWGKYILRDLKLLGAEVFAADISEEARKKAKENGAARVFTDAEDLPDCDGYIVAVPIPQLTPLSAALLKREKPVFCEKTLVLSEDDFNLLKNLGGEKYIFAMHKWHYHPGIEALRIIAEEGRIGRIKQVDTIRYHWVKDFHGGDVFWTQGVHDLTIVKHILGYIPGEIKAVNVIHNQDKLPVTFNAIIGEDPYVSLSVSGAHCFKRSGVTIHGDSGSAGLNDAYDDHILIRDIKGDERIQIDTTYPLYLELNEFVEYLRGGATPKCGLNEAWEVSQFLINLRKKAGIK